MKFKAGHSRKDRLDRLHVPGTFKMLDNDKKAMLEKLLQISKWIRFYNEQEKIPAGKLVEPFNESDESFFPHLGELEKLLAHLQKKHAHTAIGKMEPSQALLLAFVENLQKVTERYNIRWNEFPEWYLNEYLEIEPLTVQGDRVWLAFEKTAPGTVTIEKNTGFIRKNADQKTLTYRLKEEVVVQDIAPISMYSVCFERNPYYYPAANLNFVTAIKTRDLLHDTPSPDRTLIFDQEFHSRETRAIGLRIAAPSLLLREGSRSVRISFEGENRDWLKILESTEETLLALELAKLRGKLRTESLQLERRKLVRFGQNDPKAMQRLQVINRELQKIKLRSLRGGKLKLSNEELQKLRPEKKPSPPFRLYLLKALAKEANRPKLSNRELSQLKFDRKEFINEELNEWNEFKAEGIRQKIKTDIFKNLFYITISTATGWSNVNIFKVKDDDLYNQLILEFSLPEEFPSTTGCNEEIHQFQSEYPAIQIRLNFDAWLYPYSWIHKLLVQRIIIHSSVTGINDVQVYNELGKIDNSKSFPPFGINTSAGTWMAIGNYEMAIKNTKTIDVSLKWNQLPLHPKGLKGHYAAYPGNIDNDSFKVRTRYLSDNNWFPTTGTSKFTLFKDAVIEDPNEAQLDKGISDESNFNDVNIKKMTTFDHPEEEYIYTIKSRTGFVKFTLESPEMGFGNQEYRDLFTERMMMKKWRKKRLPVLHPPIFPHVENITLNYTAEDVIDLRKSIKDRNIVVDQLHPFGIVSSSDSNINTGIPFVFSQETDASILMGFNHVKGGEVFSTFLVFEAVSNEMTNSDIPQITMYWGDGYYWEEIPRGFILKDETNQMTNSGNLVYNFPAHIPQNLYDKNGILWIRTGFDKNAEFVPEIRAFHNNVGLAILETEDASVEKMQSFKNSNGILELEKKLPGISGFKQITSYFSGQELEDLKSMQVRISEFVTHRGRAVTARDFELLTLQEFSDVGKALCLPNTNLKDKRKGVVTVVVIPQNKLKTINHSKPMVPSGMLSNIEAFLTASASENVLVDAVNPVYEEIQVKCVVRLKSNRQSASLEVIHEICDNFIAPWQSKNILPNFGESINFSRLYKEISEIEFIEKIEYFAFIRISQDKTKPGRRKFHHLTKTEINPEKAKETPYVLKPDALYKLFVPAETHIIQVVEQKKTGQLSYGYGDMEIGKSFIITKK